MFLRWFIPYFNILNIFFDDLFNGLSIKNIKENNPEENFNMPYGEFVPMAF